ncbi:GNAT family N-acetyltransferase [Burkholderiaceae bacterium DAT-1]|nr:GNAT family N-acetyltransferase [Burkholderiaceae bacterium DAT-1]
MKPIQSPVVQVCHLAASGMQLRHIAPSDSILMGAFIARLSYASRYFRFGDGDFSASRPQLDALCTPDPDQVTHFVMTCDRDGSLRVMASARYVIDSETQTGEVAVLISDDWHGMGVGSIMMQALIDSARSRGLRGLLARCLRSNDRMIRLAVRHGFVRLTPADHPILNYRLAIDTPKVCQPVVQVNTLVPG